jgi:hypothetical protein
VSARRFIAAATVVIVAVLCAPAAFVPVLNTADFVVGLAPLVLVLVVGAHRRPKTPAGGQVPSQRTPSAAPPAGHLDQLAAIDPDLAAHELRMAAWATRTGSRL